MTKRAIADTTPRMATKRMAVVANADKAYKNGLFVIQVGVPVGRVKDVRNKIEKIVVV